MYRRRESPNRRPSILDLPTFRAPKGDFMTGPFTLQARSADSQEYDSRESPVYHGSGIEKTILSAKWQPYSTVLPANSGPTSPISPSFTAYESYSSQRSNDHSSSQQSSFQQPSLSILMSRTLANYSSSRLPEPVKTHSQIPRRHPSPLPLSKIRALKSTYDALNPDKNRDYLSQIRLSRALSFNTHMHKTLQNMMTLSVLPFADEDNITSAQTTWIESRTRRDQRMQERVTHWNTLQENMTRPTQPQETEGTPYIVRCGDQASGLPILVRWTTTTEDRYELYNDTESMPREIRYLLFERWGTPFGDEGKDWEVDEDGKVWVKERPHRFNRWGRWWVLQSSGLGRAGR